MDVRMPGMAGIEATRRIVVSGASARVLVLTTSDDDDVAALHAGASGCLLKDAPLEAVRDAFDGEMILAPMVARRLVAAATERHRTPSSDSRVDRLSPREREVLWLVGRGLTNTEVASQLWISEATVKTHLTRALTRLGLRDRVAAVVFCHRTGMV